MIGESQQETLASIVAAVETYLYEVEDAVRPVSGRAAEQAHAAIDALGETLSPTVSRLVAAADVNLPDEEQDGQLDWTAAKRLYAAVSDAVAEHEQSIAKVSDGVTGRVSESVMSLFPSGTEVVAALVKVMSDLVGGLLGGLAETDELWISLYTNLREMFSHDRDPITEFTADAANLIARKIGSILTDSLHGYELIGNAILSGGEPTALDPSALAARMEAWPPFIKGVVDVALHFVSAWGILSAMAAPAVSEASQAALSNNPIIPLSPGELAVLSRRRDVQHEWATEQAKRSGTSPELFDLKYLLTQRFLDVQNLIELWRRTGDDADLDDLYRQGFSTQDVERLKYLALAVPTPSDLVRFMVRDAFDDSAAAVGQYDTDFNEKINPDWNRRVGITDDTLRLYWRAHWSLPSPTMYYEMFHRGHITEAELTDALKVSDYAPGWIPKLVAINYNVPGRIDVRRMWESGIIPDRPALEKRYRDMGYSPEDAVTLADFAEKLAARSKENEAERKRAPIVRAILHSYDIGTMSGDDARAALLSIGYTEDAATARLREGDYTRTSDRADRIRKALQREYVRGFADYDATNERLSSYGFGEAERQTLLDSWSLDRELAEESEEKRHAKDLTKSEILLSYADRLIDRDSAKRGLVVLGYDEEESEVLVALEDYKLQKADARAVEQAVRTQFLARRISAIEASNTLLGFGFTTERVSALLSRWEVEQEERRPDVTPAQLEKMLVQGIVDKATIETRLRAKGYTEEDINLLLTLWGTEMALTQEQIDEKIREFNVREERLGTQGAARIGLAARGLDIREKQFTTAQAGLQQRFEAGQSQQRTLQQARLDASSAQQSQRLAAQTARDAAAFEARRAQQERQITAASDRLQQQIDAANARQATALADRDKARQQQRELADRARDAADARQSRQLQAQADRQQTAIDAAEARARQAQEAASQLADQRAANEAALAQVRATLQEARDIRLNADRIAASQRAEQVRVRQETRTQARKDITSALAAANQSQLDALRFEQSSALAELNARFAALNAQVANQRQQDALTMRLAAQASLASATPADATLLGGGL